MRGDDLFNVVICQTVLRLGVALLGARISVELMVGLGPKLIAVVIFAVILATAIVPMAAPSSHRSGSCMNRESSMCRFPRAVSNTGS